MKKQSKQTGSNLLPAGISYGCFRGLPKRTTASDKVLCDKAFPNIAKNQTFEGCQHGLDSMVYNFFDKMSAATHCSNFVGAAAKSESLSDQQLSKELQKPAIRKL